MEKTTVINGNRNLAIAEQNGVDYRLDSIAEFTPIKITDIKKGVSYVFDLTDLDQSYWSNIVNFNLPIDDQDRLEDYDDQEKTRQRIRVLIRTLKDGITISQNYLIVWSSQSNILPFVFKKGEKILIQSDDDLDSLTFYARPVLLNPTINLAKDPSFKGDTANSLSD